jgi:hypothetical protein
VLTSRYSRYQEKTGSVPIDLSLTSERSALNIAALQFFTTSSASAAVYAVQIILLYIAT